jgi:pilus assembly protein CpaF
VNDVVDPKNPRDWREAFGPLRPFLEDPSVSEIMVNGPNRVFIEQKGLVKKTPVRFNDAQELYKLMQSIVASVGKRLDMDSPYADGRLPDGSRVNCVVPPIAIDGPTLTIRRFPANTLNMQDLVSRGAMDERMAFLLHCCVQAKLNIIVSGGTGSGKTTLLNALSFSIPPHERLVSIEDSAELRLKGENVVRLEARPANPKQPAIGIRELVINSLRMRPDRIVVGECRGVETLDMLNAMNTGHEGSMTTVHANTSRDALRRIESMILLAGEDIPLKVIRQNMSSALHAIVQIARLPDGSRKIMEITEVASMEGDVILTQEIFRHTREAGFQPSGFVPKFVELFKERGVDFPSDFFNDSYRIQMRPKK